MLPDRPATYEAEGQEQGLAAWVITLLGDLMLLGIVFALLAAPTAGQPAAPGGHRRRRALQAARSIERLEDGSYVVCGEVSEIEDDAIVLDLGDHTVRVELDGHANPVGYQQPARVIGRP